MLKITKSGLQNKVASVVLVNKAVTQKPQMCLTFSVSARFNCPHSTRQIVHILHVINLLRQNNRVDSQAIKTTKNRPFGQTKLWDKI